MTVPTHYSWLILPLVTVLSAAWVCLLAPYARKVGWVDYPEGRKTHEVATPLTGGVAIFCAIAAGLVLLPGSLSALDPFLPWLLLGGLCLLFTGLVDDLRDLSAVTRFLVQIGTCLVMIRFGGVRLDDFGQLLTGNILSLGGLAVPVTVFAAMGVINAFNLIDGLDGLAAGIFIIAAAGMAGFALLSGDVSSGLFLLIAIASVVGFMTLNAHLPWNRKARVFLGDAGSLFLGFLLAWCFIRLGHGDHRAFMPMTAVWLFAVPLLDTSTLIWTRWRDGRSPFSADRRHLHHAFLRAGFSVAQTWIGIIVLALLMASLGVGFEMLPLPGYLGFYAFMLCAFAYHFYMQHSWASQRFLGRHFIHHDMDIDEGYADFQLPKR